jgi:hypothetical protein
MSTIKRKRIKPAAVSDRTQRRRHEALVAHLALIRMDTSALLSGYNMLSQRMESLRGLVDIILNESKESREDNLPTLPALRRAIEKEASGQAHLRVTARKLVDHCTRLLKEKETLQRQVEVLRGDPPVLVPDITAEPSHPAQINQAEFDKAREQRGLAWNEWREKQAAEILNQAFSNTAPTLETRNYPCGCSATGPDPLPAHCSIHGIARDCAVLHLHREGVRCAVCGA